MSFKDLIKEKLYINDIELSEGEEFISEFLKEKNIKFKKQVKIDSLKYDRKNFRVSDFYLPKFKIYIEFLGMWNKNVESRNEYIEKMKLYKINNIPCVYLFPENLGFLEFVLDYRISKELKKHKMWKQVFLHNTHRLMKDRGDLLFWLLLSFICLVFGNYDGESKTNLQYIGFFLSILLFQIYRLIIGYNKYYRDKKYDK